VIGVYQPGDSLLHRLPAGFKLAALFVLLVGIAFLRTAAQIGIAAAVTVLLIALAGVPWRSVAEQCRPLRWFLPVLFVLQWIGLGWEPALVVCGGLLLAVALASLVTLTTRVTAILDLTGRLLRPLRRVGVDPDRVGLLIALTIRCVPLMSEILRQVQEARKARGAGFSLRALAVPVVVRALRSADAIGEALIARGVDD
jgi:biotin transport system permease protein